MDRDALDQQYLDAISKGDERVAAGIVEESKRLDEEERRRRESVTLHEAALYYVSLGLHVFPLHPGLKVPFARSQGCKDATSESEKVNTWWTRSPDANIGIATGHLIDVVDIDGAPGQKSRARFWDEAFAGIDDKNVGKVLTPSPGGMHIYVRSTGDGNGASIADGVDYRGLGGYVVAPPSRTPDGSYRWLGQLDIDALVEIARAS